MSIYRRTFDVAGALGGLLAFAPVMAAAALAIRLDDRRPVFFRQERTGRGRRPFTILKFRSMREGQVTRVGRILRATGLDEIPQFINILRGDMSAVGPRPLTDADVRRLGWTSSAHDFRWSARPGLTGLAQILGARGADASLELDRVYLERQSLLLDCTLVGLSFCVNAFGKQRVRAMAGRYKLTN